MATRDLLRLQSPMSLIPATPLAAGLESLFVAFFLLALGFLIAGAALHFLRWDLTFVSRLALALPALVFYVFVLMLLHIITGGRVLSSFTLVRVLTIGLFLVLVWANMRWGSLAPTIGRGQAFTLGGLCLLGLILWTIPNFTLLPPDHTGDVSLHMGWTSQLINGETTPTAPITGHVPNYYPWMFHALSAFTAAFMPGGRAFLALDPIEMILVTAAIFGLFALGIELGGSTITGASAALFGALTGGFGYFVTQSPTLLLFTRGQQALHYLGDFFYTRPYNFAFHNINAPYPRDLCFAQFPAMLLLITLGLKRKSTTLLVAAGVILGIIGLTGEPFIVGFLACALIGLWPDEAGRVRYALCVLLPALLLWALWVGPLFLNKINLGFVSLAKAPVVLPWWAILGGWGITTPFAVYGLVRCIPRWRELTLRPVIALLAASSGMVIGATLVTHFLGGTFKTLSFQHRYWPLVSLSLALFGSLGATDLFKRLGDRSRWVAAAAAGLVTLLAIPSPLLGSLGEKDALSRSDKPRTSSILLQKSLEGDPQTLLNRLAPSPGMRCTAAVPAGLSFRVFSYTGYRLLLYTRTAAGQKMAQTLEKAVTKRKPPPSLMVWSNRSNFAGLRWKKIYKKIPPDWRRLPANTILTRALVPLPQWRQIADRYGIDVVALPERFARGHSFAPLRTETAIANEGKRMVLVWLHSC
jgi:hypothetical protein